ncbi:MAG: hypothetical protein ACYCVD_07020 [Desulfitobacteriaceae bacterium]
MFVTLVFQPSGVLLAAWAGQERPHARAWLENTCINLTDPVEPARSKQEILDWLAQRGIHSVDAVVWQRPREVTAWFTGLVEGLAKALGGTSQEIPLWWEETLPEIAQVSGFLGIVRRGVYDKAAHEAAFDYASLELGRAPGRYIVASLGDGVSVAAYAEGRLLDVNNARDGEGPMGLKYTGSLPTELLIDWAFTSGETLSILEERLEQGGWSAYEGKMTQAKWESILAYQVLKEIGAMQAVLKQEVELIVLTGELAYRTEFIDKIILRLPVLIPVIVVPGVDRALGLARIWDKGETGP